MFVDARVALDSQSRRPVYAEIVLLCKALLKRTNVTFYWIPSHVGIPQNEKTFVLARCGAERDEYHMMCHLSIRQIRNIVRQEQHCIDRNKMIWEHGSSSTFKHHYTASDCVAVSWGRDGQ